MAGPRTSDPRTGGSAPVRAVAAGIAGPEAVVRRCDLGDIAWQVLVHEGAVVPLTDDAGLPAGIRVRPCHRAAALVPRVPPGEVLIGRAAVWVHLGGPAPRGVESARPVAARAVPAGAGSTGTDAASTTPTGTAAGPDRSAPPPRRPGARRDLIEVGGLLLPDLVGTAVDVARRYPAEAALPLLLRLADEGGLSLDRVWEALGARSGWRGVRRAESTLRQALVPARAG